MEVLGYMTKSVCCNLENVIVWYWGYFNGDELELRYVLEKGS